MNRVMPTPSEMTMSAAQGTCAFDTHAAFTEYLKQGGLTPNTSEMQRLSVTLYRLLGRGAPVAREQLAAACGLSRERATELLFEFPPAMVTLDERAAIVAFGGLSLAPTRHRFVTEEAELLTWCVFDALFLPEILGKSATLVTHCPASGVELIVEMAPGELCTAPSSSVMSIVTPDREACCDNLRKAFCDQVNLFADRRAFIDWSRGRDVGGCITLQEAQLFARQRNALRYPNVDLRTGPLTE